jgi:hypothetical protein
MRPRGGHFSEAEIEAIRRLNAAGRTAAEIAAELGFAKRSVKRWTSTMPAPGAKKKPLPPRHYSSNFEL